MQNRGLLHALENRKPRRDSFCLLVVIWGGLLVLPHAIAADSVSPNASPPNMSTPDTSTTTDTSFALPKPDDNFSRAARSIGLVAGTNTNYVAVLIAVKNTDKQQLFGFNEVAHQVKAKNIGLMARTFAATAMADPLYHFAPKEIKQVIAASKVYGRALLNMRTEMLPPAVEQMRGALVNYARSHENPKQALSNPNIQVLLLSVAWLKGLSSKEISDAEEVIKNNGLAAAFARQPASVN